MGLFLLPIVSILPQAAMAKFYARKLTIFASFFASNNKYYKDILSTTCILMTFADMPSLKFFEKCLFFNNHPAFLCITVLAVIFLCWLTLCQVSGFHCYTECPMLSVAFVIVMLIVIMLSAPLLLFCRVSLCWVLHLLVLYKVSLYCITVLLTSCLTGFESAVRQLIIFVFICKTD